MTDDRKTVKAEYPNAACKHLQVRHEVLYFIQVVELSGHVNSLSFGRQTEAGAWACAARTIESEQIKYSGK